MACITTVGKNRQRVRIFAGRDATGKKVYVSKTITATKPEALKYGREWETKRDLGAQITAAKLTLDSHLKNWLRRKQGHVKQVTIEHYKGAIERHIPPTLATARLPKIQPVDIQNLYAQLIESGCGVPLVRYIHVLLANAFKEAKRLRLIADNPMVDVIKPQALETNTSSMTPDQAKYFLRVLLDDDLILSFALHTGLRPEEYLAIRWDDMELDGRPYLIVRQVVEFHKEGFRFSSATKTKAGFRQVFFPKHLALALKRHRIRQNEHRLAAGRHYHDNGLVFATIVGTPIRRSNLTDRQFKPALKRAGLPNFRLYDLRHTWFTISIMAGGDLKSISEQGGHKDVETTLHFYHHVLKGMKEDAAEKFEKFMAQPISAHENEGQMTDRHTGKATRNLNG